MNLQHMQCGVISVELQTDEKRETHYGFCAVLCTFTAFYWHFVAFFSSLCKDKFPKAKYDTKTTFVQFLWPHKLVKKRYCKMFCHFSCKFFFHQNIMRKVFSAEGISSAPFSGQFISKHHPICHTNRSRFCTSNRQFDIFLPVVSVNDIQDQKWHQVTIKK